jgi:hypothetical protein
MKKVRLITGVLTAALIAVSFAGCGDNAETQDVSALKQEQGQNKTAAQDHKGTMAKVVSLNGNQLTVVLADMPDRGDGVTPPAMSAPTDGTAPPDNAAPSDGSNPPAPPNGGSGPASGTAIDSSGAPAGGPGQPGQPGQNGQPGEGGGKIEFTGEQATYTLSDNVSIMKGMGDSAAEIDLSELKADDVVRFTTATDDGGNEVIDSIVVME